MASEIERKFLVRMPIEWPGEEVASSAEITQGYLTPLGAQVEVRLRRAREVTRQTAGAQAPASKTGPHGVNRVWKMTVKVPLGETHGQLVREEIEIDLSEAEFERLWPQTEGRRVKKVRTSCFLRTSQDEMLDTCVDDFRGDLTGLALAEVEFESEEEASAFIPPPFFGREVTDDPRYRNEALAGASEPPPVE